MNNFEEELKKLDKRTIQSKLKMAIDTLRKGNIDELAALFNSTDKDVLIDKLYEIDSSTLRKLNINTGEIKKNLTNSDLEKLSRIIGKRGNEVVKRIKEILG